MGFKFTQPIENGMTEQGVMQTDIIDDATLGKNQAELNALFNQGKNAAGQQVGKTYTAGTGISLSGDNDTQINLSTNYILDTDNNILKVYDGDTAYVCDLVVLEAPTAPSFSGNSSAELVSGENLQVTITNTAYANGAIVYYTTNGTSPSSYSYSFKGNKVVVPLPVNINREYTPYTLKAKAVLRGQESGIISSQYTISRKVSKPTITIVAGTDKYDASRDVTISCSTTGASIYYTTDNTEPDENSTSYNGTISVTSSVTIKAKAFLTDWVDSDVSNSVTCKVNSPKTYILFTTTSNTPTEEAIINSSNAFKRDELPSTSSAALSVTSSEASYCWVCQPNTLNPDNIYEGDTTINAGFENAQDVANWHCYRSTNKWVADTYSLYCKP